MMPEEPKISVILPTHNDEKYIGAAIDSILKQTFSDFELIIINDGSTDNTESIIERYAELDCRVKVVHRSNSGIVSSLNYGISIALGSYIARMDGDDLSLPMRFEHQVNYLERNLDVVAIGSMFSFINEDAKILKNEMRAYKIANSDLYGPRPFNAWMCHPAAMIRKSALIKIGGYRYFIHSEDADLWMRLEEIGYLRNFPDILFQWRRHPGRVSIKGMMEQKKWHALSLIMARRRREGVPEYNLSTPATFDEVYSTLSPYELKRFESTLSLLRYEYQIYLGDDALSCDEIEAFINGYAHNPAAGLSFLPNESKIFKIRDYPQRRLSDYIMGREVRDIQIPWYKKLKLKYGLLAKNNNYKKYKIIPYEEIKRIKLLETSKIKAEFNEQNVDDTSSSSFSVDSYASGNYWGHEAVNAVKMAQQTFNVLPKSRVVFAECSKNACTTIKKAFSLFEHIESGYLPIAKDDAIHYKARNLFLGIDDLTLEYFQNTLASPNWFKFCICRNPYDRLASAYTDKIAGLFSLKYNSRKEYTKISRDILRLTRGWEYCLEAEIQEQPITFSEFIDYIVQQGSYYHDRHWLSQYITMRPDIVKYDTIVRFEECTLGMMEICEHLSMPEYVRQILNRKYNARRVDNAWQGLYSPQTASLVYDLYQSDFEAFEYSREAWK